MSDQSTQKQFLEFAIAQGVLRFGDFITKAGRNSPYFFNAGLFHHGKRLGLLASFYAQTFLRAEQAGVWGANLLYGPAYKGITLASATAVALATMGRDIGFAFNRKELKDHGEGGRVVGAPLSGDVVIVDDVISAGTSVRESVQLIESEGARVAGVLIALDRMERGGTAQKPTDQSAVQEVEQTYGIPVVSIASLADLLALLLESDNPELRQHQPMVSAYRAKWGVEDS